MVYVRICNLFSWMPHSGYLMQDARCRNAIDCKLPIACCMLILVCRLPPVICHLSSVHCQLLLVVRGPWSFFSFHPNILLNIQPLYPKIFNFLYSALNKCIVLDLYSKSEIMSLPFPGAAIFQMLSIRTIL